MQSLIEVSLGSKIRFGDRRGVYTLLSQHKAKNPKHVRRPFVAVLQNEQGRLTTVPFSSQRKVRIVG